MATAKPVAPALCLIAVEGWGKTSCAAHVPDVAVLMARGETGYETLLSQGSVPARMAASISEWPHLLEVLDQLIADPGGIKAVALDAMGGFERLCHEFICARDFKGNWGEKGFASFAKGYDVSVSEWLLLLQRLERLKANGITVIMLGHVLVKPFKNPVGEDFDRYVCDVHHKTWAPTHRFADAVLFGTYQTIVDKQGGRPKGIGGDTRILHTTRSDAWDAKNRYQMPETIAIPSDPTQIWTTIQAHMERKQ